MGMARRREGGVERCWLEMGGDQPHGFVGLSRFAKVQTCQVEAKSKLAKSKLVTRVQSRRVDDASNSYSERSKICASDATQPTQ
jgi:hypothetical protein